MSLQHIPDEFRREFTIDESGKVTVTAAGISRLCGVSKIAVGNLLKKVNLTPPESPKTLAAQSFESVNLTLPESLKTLSAQGLGGGAQLSDIQASCIIEYYAFDAGWRCPDQAKSVYRSFAAIGFRSWVQHELNWQPSARSSGWQRVRLEGKAARRTLTDSVKDYIDRHPELSENAIKFMYSNMSDAAYCKTHGKKHIRLSRFWDARKIIYGMPCQRISFEFYT